MAMLDSYPELDTKHEGWPTDEDITAALIAEDPHFGVGDKVWLMTKAGIQVEWIDLGTPDWAK